MARIRAALTWGHVAGPSAGDGPALAHAVPVQESGVGITTSASDAVAPLVHGPLTDEKVPPPSAPLLDPWLAVRLSSPLNRQVPAIVVADIWASITCMLSVVAVALPSTTLGAFRSLNVCPLPHLNVIASTVPI